MNSGVVDLRGIYELISTYDFEEILNGNSKTGRYYSTLVREITEAIENLPGFYLWGYYDSKRVWKNLYLGKAGYGKTTTLRARILEELRDERIFLFGRDNGGEVDSELVHRAVDIYAGKYRTHFQRALKKQKTTHIIWVAPSELTNREVSQVEADLIETLNPISNDMRPVPPMFLQDARCTKEIIGEFRKHIHVSRPSARRMQNLIKGVS